MSIADLPKEILPQIIANMDEFGLVCFAKTSAANYRAVFAFLKEIRPNAAISQTFILNRPHLYLPLVKAYLLNMQIKPTTRDLADIIKHKRQNFLIFVVFKNVIFAEERNICNKEYDYDIANVFLKYEYLPILQKMMRTDFRKYFIPSILSLPPYSSVYLRTLILNVDEPTAKAIYNEFILPNVNKQSMFNNETLNLVRKIYCGKFSSILYEARD